MLLLCAYKKEKEVINSNDITPTNKADNASPIPSP